MIHADPWDEVARLEWEVELELLAQLERSRWNEAKGPPPSERIPVDRAQVDASP